MKNIVTNRFGLMRTSQSDFESFLPFLIKNTWKSDAKAQEPNYKSLYVLEMIYNDTIYISGPSGMTTLLLGLMEYLVNFEKISSKQIYLNAIATYICGAGFHSLHEVLSVASLINLVPGYHSYIPGTFSRDTLPPPNYHHYFSLQMDIDSEFKKQYENVWESYLHFFETKYIPAKIPELYHLFDTQERKESKVELEPLPMLLKSNSSIAASEAKITAIFPLSPPGLRDHSSFYPIVPEDCKQVATKLSLTIHKEKDKEPIVFGRNTNRNFTFLDSKNYSSLYPSIPDDCKLLATQTSLTIHSEEETSTLCKHKVR